MDVVVVGQVGRDLVLRVGGVPGAGGSAPVRGRVEVLGGKGANQAVACAQLGLAVGLVGVVGDDRAADDVLAQARADGIDVRHVVRRAGAATALLLDVVADGGERRLLEHVADDVLLRPADVRSAAGAVRGARAVLLQLQQPAPAIGAALDACGPDALVVADGAPQDDGLRERLVATAHVLRADAAEAGVLVGRPVGGVAAGVEAARELVARGPRVVALEAGDANVVAWDGGHVVVPLLGGAPVDPTGAGDSFVGGLTAALLAGHDPATAGWWASAAAASTVGRLGGRPDLDPGRLADAARRARVHHGG
ncbi:PfkB family carbohydrate kinase [Cellulomonas sp. NPDC057328]|uniref:PfkB family carbohydrate kinase n=1 Tax=Cellulomonas sp. NPDC057328 TaxID=3346101 RepID=UPI003633942B